MSSLSDRTRRGARRVAGGVRRRRRALTGLARARLGPYRQQLRRTSRREVNTVYARPLSDGAPAVPRQDGFRVVPADEDNLAELKATYPKELTDRKYGILRHRVQDPAEDAWIVVDDDGASCGFACLAWQDHEIKMMRHQVKVGPHQALFIDDHVFRAHRRRGAHTASVAARVAIAGQRGRTEGLVLIEVKNVGSITSYRSLGFRPIGKLVHLKEIRRTVEVRRPGAFRSRSR